MAFYLCVNGHLHSFDFQYAQRARMRPRLEPTLVPGMPRPAPRPSKVPYVSEWMSKKLITVELTTPLNLARNLMLEKGLHHLPVVAFNRLVGVLSDRDLLKNPKAKLTHEAMTHTVVVCDGDTPLFEVCEVFAKENVSCIPVLGKAAQLEGILTTKDVLKWAYETRPQ